ncbi:MAG: hypothetical protein C0390_08180 [Syntrophus sp. (in: bacteria)]|nr:hypothetical protein [Syntrophus sp. (in: bacteria)]
MEAFQIPRLLRQPHRQPCFSDAKYSLTGKNSPPILSSVESNILLNITSMSKSRIRQVLLHVLLLTSTVTISISVGEWILSNDYFLYNSQKLKIYEQTHEIREIRFFHLTHQANPPYLMAPNTSHHFWWNASFQTNATGFLGDDLSEPGRLNLLFIGDSVTFGLGVQQNETYPEQLRRLIPNTRISIMAAPGYNTEHELEVLRRALNKKEFVPDIVFLQFNNNDYIRPIKTDQREKYYFYQKVPTKVFCRPAGAYKFLLDHSNIFFRLNQLLTKWFAQWIPLTDYPNRHQEIKHQLLELKQLGEQFHFQVVFLYIPEREEFGMTPQRLKEIESFGSLFPHSLDFRPLILNKPWLWFDCSHPNALGHKIIAEGIFHALKSAQ